VTALTGRDLVQAADRLRGRLQDPKNVWAARRDPDHDLLQTARTFDRDTADYLGQAAVLACAATDSQLRRLSAGLAPDGRLCRWCHALQRAPQVGKLPPVTEATLALLGDPCSRCAPLVARVALAAMDEAVSQPSPVPGRESVAAAAGRQDATRRSLTNVTRAPAPTGVLWPASEGQPATVTAALQATSRRPRRWPR